MSYFEDLDMNRVENELKTGKTYIVAVFHNIIILRGNENRRFCWLRNDEQVIIPKSAGRGMMVSEFVCPCHGKMVDKDTGKPC